MFMTLASPPPPPPRPACVLLLQANAPKFYRIDCSSCLENQLAGKTVVEFPVFIVALPEEVASYPMAAAGGNPDE